MWMNKDAVLAYIYDPYCNGPLNPREFTDSDPYSSHEFFSKNEEAFVAQDPSACLDALLEIALDSVLVTKIDQSIFDPLQRERIAVGELLGVCARLLPDLYEFQAKVLPLLNDEIARPTLISGIGEVNLPQVLDWLAPLVPQAPTFTDYTVIHLVDAIGGNCHHVNREYGLSLLRQLQILIEPARKEVHHEIELFLNDSEEQEAPEQESPE